MHLTPDEYLVHVSSKSKSLRYFNAQVKCPACGQSFAGAMSDNPNSLETIPGPEYYVHCLSKCEGYMKRYMKSCDVCSHRYLNEEEFKSHRRGYCSKYKEKVFKLKLKMPWMQRQMFLDLLDLNLNAHMCCEACHQKFPCHKKGENYTPSLELQCHMLEDCVPFRESGMQYPLFVSCPDSVSLHIHRQNGRVSQVLSAAAVLCLHLAKRLRKVRSLLCGGE